MIDVINQSCMHISNKMQEFTYSVFSGQTQLGTFLQFADSIDVQHLAQTLLSLIVLFLDLALLSSSCLLREAYLSLLEVVFEFLRFLLLSLKYRFNENISINELNIKERNYMVLFFLYLFETVPKQNSDSAIVQPIYELDLQMNYTEPW